MWIFIRNSTIFSPWPRQMEPVEFSFWGPRRCYYSCQSLTLRALVSNTKMTGKLGVLNLFLDVGVVREKVLLMLLRYRVESEK